MTTNFTSHFNSNWLNKLLSSPTMEMSDIFAGSHYQAKVIIPNYKQRVAEFYKNELNGDLDQFCREFDFPLVFKHFGIELSFEKPQSLKLHDTDMMMPDILHQIIRETGCLIIKNAYLDSEHRDMGHRNRFPQLNFHVDRSEKQPTHYSMYTRNPFDEEQKQPRTSSTLFVSSVIGHLQTAKEKKINPRTADIKKGTYQIFESESINGVFNKIVVEHAWNEPLGIGEISMLDNINCLHASYYPQLLNKGYKIGVRYVG